MAEVGARDAIRAAVEMTDKSGMQVSREIGLHEKAVNSYMTKRTNPNIKLFAAICRACGLRLEMARGDEVIVIDPPPKR